MCVYTCIYVYTQRYISYKRAPVWRYALCDETHVVEDAHGGRKVCHPLILAPRRGILASMCPCVQICHIHIHVYASCAILCAYAHVLIFPYACVCIHICIYVYMCYEYSMHVCVSIRFFMDTNGPLRRWIYACACVCIHIYYIHTSAFMYTHNIPAYTDTMTDTAWGVNDEMGSSCITSARKSNSCEIVCA